ncbi:MAG: hypothetical protein JWP27_637 [Flaviaesturariibacter sp.]|nr:hypothetical protein [Flaviaesturariibacter sp.]
MRYARCHADACQRLSLPKHTPRPDPKRAREETFGHDKEKKTNSLKREERKEAKEPQSIPFVFLRALPAFVLHRLLNLKS